jgi:hypothetical protein
VALFITSTSRLPTESSVFILHIVACIHSSQSVRSDVKCPASCIDVHESIVELETVTSGVPHGEYVQEDEACLLETQHADFPLLEDTAGCTTRSSSPLILHGDQLLHLLVPFLPLERSQGLQHACIARELQRYMHPQ